MTLRRPVGIILFRAYIKTVKPVSLMDARGMPEDARGTDARDARGTGQWHHNFWISPLLVLACCTFIVSIYADVSDLSPWHPRYKIPKIFNQKFPRFSISTSLFPKNTAKMPRECHGQCHSYRSMTSLFIQEQQETIGVQHLWTQQWLDTFLSVSSHNCYYSLINN